MSSPRSNQPRPHEPASSAVSSSLSFGMFMRALASLLAALVLVVGVPVALVLAVGWPLPTEIPTWEGFRDALEQQGLTTDVLINALTVVVWLAWLPLTWAILVEAMAAGRGRVARHVHAWPGAQFVARRLVASATLLASSLAGAKPVPAEPLGPLVIAADDVPPDELPGGPGDHIRLDLSDPGGSVSGVRLPEGNGGGSGGGGLRSGWYAGTTFSGAEPGSGGDRGAAARVAVVGEYLGARAYGPVGGATGGDRSEMPDLRVGRDRQVQGSTARHTTVVSSNTTEGQGRGTTTPEVVHVTEKGDTFWGLAERYLSSGLRWREIRDHNVGQAVAPGVTMAPGEDHLQVGWRIVIPGTATSVTQGRVAGPTVAATSDEGSTPSASDASAEEPGPSATAAMGNTDAQDPNPPAVTIRPGDHFWGLAERRLEAAWGRPVTPEEVAPYWQQMVAANLDNLSSGNPDVIFPGEEFSVPTVPPSPGGPAPRDPGRSRGTGAGGDSGRDDGAAPGDGSPSPEGGTSAEAPVGEPRPDSEVSNESSAAPAAPIPTTVPAGVDNLEERDTEALDDQDELTDEDEDPSLLPVLVPFGASAALAGLLLFALGRRRQSRRRLLKPRQVIEPRSQEDARLEQQFARSAEDLHDTIGAASRAWGAALATNPGLPIVTGLVVSPALDVLVQLATAAEPEVPFEPGPASDRWELYLDELDLDPELGPGPDAAPPVLDTPVVLGRSAEGDWAVIDLESLGALEIDGNRRVASDLVRSIVAELAMQPQADRMVDITVVGVDGLSPDVHEQGVVTFDRLDEDLVRRVERVAAEADAMQPHRGAAARAQGFARDGLFVTVVALGGSGSPDPMLLQRLAAAATPGGRGVAVVAVGSLGPGAARVLVGEDGQGHIPHLGMTVDLAQLGADDLRRVERLLADEPEMWPSEGDDAVPESWPQWPASWSEPDAADAAPGAWMGVWKDMLQDDASGGAMGVEPDVDLDGAAAGLAGTADSYIEAEAHTAPGQTSQPGGVGFDEDAPEADLGAGTVPQTGEQRDQDVAEADGGMDVDDASAEPEHGDGGRAMSGTQLQEPEVREPDLAGFGVEAEQPDAGTAEEIASSAPAYEPPAWELCVRVFADHVVETPDGMQVSFKYGQNPDVPNKNAQRGPELVAYLALSGRAATAEEIRDNLWWDRPVALGTVNKLVYGARKVLGGAEYLSHAQEDPLGRYRLSPAIVTDAQLLVHALEHARLAANLDPDAAADVLRRHLATIETVAFRGGHLGQGLMEWASAYRIVDAVEQPVVEASLLLARLSCERGRSGYYDALWAIDQGLRACPFNEALVRMAMEIEALLGNTDAVNHRYLMLATRLARDELEPEPETSDLRARLGGTSRLRSAG